MVNLIAHHFSNVNGVVASGVGGNNFTFKMCKGAFNYKSVNLAGAFRANVKLLKLINFSSMGRTQPPGQFCLITGGHIFQHIRKKRWPFH